MSMRRVLLLGARSPACLEWCRSFAAAGWEVFTADSMRNTIAGASKYSSAYLRLPPTRTALDAWIRAISEAVEQKGIELVLPTCEEAFFLSLRRSALSRCTVPVSPIALMRQLHNKEAFARLAGKLPISAPSTERIASVEELEIFLESSGEWVFKAAWSRFAARTLVKPTRQAMRNFAAKHGISPAVPLLAQQYVAGDEYCTFGIFYDGILTAHCCYRPRYRAGIGAGIYLEPARIEELEVFARVFGQKTGYTGQAGFDFIHTAKGQWQVLECNPRATSGVHFFTECRKEFVATLMGNGPKSGGILRGDEHPRMLTPALLLYAGRNALRTAFWRDVLRRRARDFLWDPADPAPSFAQFVTFGDFLRTAIRRNISVLEATTHDIEWNGEGGSTACS